MERKLMIDTSTSDTDESILEKLPPRIRDIYTMRPNIIKASSGRLCHYSPVNFIGASIVIQHLDEYQDAYTKKGFPIPDILETPYQLLHDIPLAIYQKDVSRYVSVDITADTIFLKRCMGEIAGVVTQGVYTGMLVTPIHNVDVSQGMCISRLWNDSVLKDNPKSYSPNGFITNEYNIALAIERSIKEYFYDVVVSASDDTSLSDLFISNSRQNGIYVDDEQFVSIMH